MSESKPTDGEWFAECVGSEGFFVKVEQPYTTSIKKKVIARHRTLAKTAWASSWDEQKANAQIMAASKELLAACKIALTAITNELKKDGATTENFDELRGLITAEEELTAAIQKAEIQK